MFITESLREIVEQVWFDPDQTQQAKCRLCALRHLVQCTLYWPSWALSHLSPHGFGTTASRCIATVIVLRRIRGDRSAEEILYQAEGSI